MKIVRIILFVLFINPLFGCAQDQHRVDVIGMTHISGGGDHVSVKLIGPDSNMIFKVYNSGLDYKQSMDVNPYVISPDAINYIVKYIDDNCNATRHSTPKSRDLINIELISNYQSLQVCFLVDQPEYKPYFDGLITWLEKSPYKDECRKFINSLKIYTK